MRFGILGQTEVWLEHGRPVPVGGPGLRALLGLLLLGAGRVVTGERLIDGLYGAEPPANATNALQAQVSRLRQQFGDLVVRHPAGYRLAVDPDDVDALRFERLAAEGRRALSSGDHHAAARLLREALGLWRGPALADVPDAPFAATEAARLEELRLDAAEDLADAALALGEHRDLLPELQQRVTAHPLRERSIGQLMRALYSGGRQAEALAAFEDTRRRLADELGADPSAELSAIHLAVLRSDPSLSPATAARRSMPAQLTTMVGRAEELRLIDALLDEARLVTLTGPGGTGKTRLAAEAAARRPGGVCFVELAPLGDGTDVPQTVLAALGLQETGLLAGSAPGRQAAPPDPLARLVAALSDRPPLLVLDNCEHVVEETARLADRLLAACPSLRVLATSREALGITGERLVPVPPLALPPSGGAGHALSYPAVELFVERARAVRPGFELDASITEDVLRVCRALDGLPLAIELAAARLRSMSATEIATRLGVAVGTGAETTPEPGDGSPADRFALLSRGSRTAQPRHRTLRAVVEWSWNLLDDTERALARRLTVFVGGATLNGAEQVCGVPGTDGVLASLVEKSLVEVVGDRYRMLDTIRAFCAERLVEAGEEERLHDAHSAYLLRFAETADVHLRRSEQLDWLRRLDDEHDNLHAAVRRAARSGDTARALRLLSASTGYWLLRGLRSEATGLARDLLARIGPQVPDGLDEEYALSALFVVWGDGHDAGLGPSMETALRMVDGLPTVPRQPYVYMVRAIVGGPPERGTVLEVPPGLLDADPWVSALVNFGSAFLQAFNGRLQEAEHQVVASVAAVRAVGDRWLLVTMLSALADLVTLRGDYGEVEAICNEALEFAEQLGAVLDVAEILSRRAGGRVRIGDDAGARADYERAAALARRAGAPEILAIAHLGLGEMARLHGDLGVARALFEKALAECTADSYAAEEARVRLFLALGWIAQMGNDAAEALAWHRRALATVVSDRDLSLAARVAEGLAGVALLHDDGERAALLLGVGTALRGSAPIGDPDAARVVARCRALLGDGVYDDVYERGTRLTAERMTAVTDAPEPALTVLARHLSAFGG
ncbi:BTAD domain-containing putative transcriptional regulator [Planotetraspora kaengkrachanensis]|uniref:SARP family transcriptional regulator n=1 Tax=Planotetraspora kaengkrachanensis TaxID=575193 RepID=A0A8J3PSC1_9ACTN|nr:BTAD domain-containing putative transcriptional regulator [Planotetraspora kaengkrachanensis]GIG79279.1 SARP family transcriptional regulator [Planotetraspora kaengkrachanensis]